jgi:hypothetical protein
MKTSLNSLASLQALVTVRDELRERRQARRDYRDLARELSSYNTRADVDDLLASIAHQEGSDAELVRRILTQNLLSTSGQRPIAS